MFDLSAPFKQSELAKFLKLSEAAISKHVKCGNINTNGSNAVALVSYINHLRAQASGRSGDEKESLTRARIEESQAKTAMLALKFQTEIKALVPAAEVAQSVRRWANFTNREIGTLLEKVRVEINSAHKVDVEPEEIHAIAAATFASIASAAKECAQAVDAGSESV